jgi:hypothetical protein
LSPSDLKIPTSTSHQVTPERHHIVRFVRRTPCRYGLNIAARRSSVNGFSNRGLSRRLSPNRDRSNITTDEQHFQIGSTAPCQAQRVEPRES